MKLERYPDSLVVTEAAPLMDYICSMRVRSRISDEQVAALRQHLENEIAELRRNSNHQGHRLVHRAALKNDCMRNSLLGGFAFLWCSPNPRGLLPLQNGLAVSHAVSNSSMPCAGDYRPSENRAL